MFDLNAKAVVNCLNGLKKKLKLQNNTVIKKIATNHKEATHDSIFIALKGERFDGHNFAQQAIENGSIFVVVEHEQKNDIPQIIVKNTRNALLSVAALNREKFKGQLIAITGSAGKTTTKDLISLALTSSETVLKTEKNLNNEIGVSQTLLNLNSTHTAAVVEMGMSHKGEISAMSIAAKPTIGVLTNIGYAHFQNFNSLNEILNAKLELLNGMSSTGTIIFNADDEHLKNCKFQNKNTIGCSINSSKAEIFANEIEQLKNQISFNVIVQNKKPIKVKLPTIGIHNVTNSLFSFAVATILKLDLEQVAKQLENFKPTGLRQKIFKCDGVEICADCYNANPNSMKEALISVSQKKCSGKRIAVLGDMLELGKIAENEHKKIGTLLNDLPFDEIMCIGELSRNIVKMTKKPATHFESAEQLAQFLKNKLKPNDLVLFKASRSIKLEQIIKQIFNEPEL